MKNLEKLKNNVTLVCIDGGIEPETSANAVNLCLEKVGFKNSYFICPFEVEHLNPKVNFVKCERLSYHGYNEFLLNKLYEYCKGTHVLLIQSDGFILNPENWMDEFLDYDFVGAPWPNWHTLKGKRVGNGGFSLRSNKFLGITKVMSYDRKENEDVFALTNDLVARQLRLPSVELAIKFSYENPIPEFPDWTCEKSFGFHANGSHLPGHKYLGLVL